MKTVTDQTFLHTRVVTDRTEIDRLRWFQTTRYFECGLLRELPTRLPDDPHVDKSTYFGVYDEHGALHATARIVEPEQDIELLHHHHLYPSAESRLLKERHCVAEVSRLAVSIDAPRFEALSLLTREFFRHGIKHQGGLLLVASIGKPLVRLLTRLLGIPVEIIGPEVDRYGDYIEDTLPVVIDTVRCLDVLRRRDTRLWEFFAEDLVIDLTDSLDLTDSGDLNAIAS